MSRDEKTIIKIAMTNNDELILDYDLSTFTEDDIDTLIQIQGTLGRLNYLVNETLNEIIYDADENDKF
jgi:hypothetical protein